MIRELLHRFFLGRSSAPPHADEALARWIPKAPTNEPDPLLPVGQRIQDARTRLTALQAELPQVCTQLGIGAAGPAERDAEDLASATRLLDHLLELEDALGQIRSRLLEADRTLSVAVENAVLDGAPVALEARVHYLATHLRRGARGALHGIGKGVATSSAVQLGILHRPGAADELSPAATRERIQQLLEGGT